MKIGVYARGLSGMGGVKQYIESMCHGLMRGLPDEDEFFIFHNRKAPFFERTPENVHEVLLDADHNFTCDFHYGPKAIKRISPDVMWFTKYVVPFGLKMKTVTTVHDMAYFMPHLCAYPFADTLYMRTMIRNSCRRADEVIAVSSNTKADLLSLLGLTSEKVHVIPEAAGKAFRIIEDRSELTAFRARYNLPERFILFTGGISPRKNLSRLFDAFTSISKRIPHKLVLTGGKGWRNRKVVEQIERSADIIRLGFVPDEDMPHLYNAADLFVYPSLYEGFGLPILEASQCGTPVISAEGSSLTEVGGKGVQFINPRSTEDIAQAMLDILEHPEKQRDLIQRGLCNAQRFSWDDSARSLLSLLHSIG